MAARARIIQNSFTAGEVSPRMFGRTDFEKYFSACELLENWTILPQGGATRRSGTKFVAEVKDSALGVALIPFLFNDVQAYVLEAGVGYFRFFKDNGQIFVDDTDAVIANGTFTTDLIGWTERNAGTGDVVQAAPGVARFIANGAGNEARLNQSVAVGAGFQAKPHVLRFRVVSGALLLRVGTAAGGEQVMAAKTYETGWHTVSFTPGASPIFPEFENNGTVIASLDDVRFLDNEPLEIQSPYTAAVLDELQRDQSADVMWIAHRAFKPRELRRMSDIDWSLIEYKPVADPFTILLNGTFDKSIDSWITRNAGTGATTWDSATKRAQLVSGAAGNEARLYQSVVTLASPHTLRFSVFTAAVTMRIGTTIGGGEVLGAASFAVGDHEVVFTPPASAIFIEFEAPASTTTRIDNVELDGATLAGNYPRGVAFWKSRLWWGGTDNDPQKVWGTRIDEFNNLDLGTALDAEAISRTIAGGKINVVQWLVPGGSRELLIGTLGSEMLLHGDRDGIVTPAKTSVDDGTEFGSDIVPPERADNFILFVQRGRARLRQFFFDFNTDKHHATDLTLIAEHVMKPGVHRLAYQGDPDPSLWAIRDDGQLLGLAFIFHEKIAGWHRQTTQGMFEDLAVIPHPKGDRDQVWLTARRLMAPKTITGAANNGGGLIRITTSAAHGLSTGHQVVITGVLGVPADGTWIVTNITGTTFDLQGSAFVGAYVSGGKVERVRRYVEFLEDNDGHYGRLGVDSGLTFNGKELSSTTITLSSAGVGFGVTVTASAALFSAADVGEELWHPLGQAFGRSLITAFTNGTTVTVQNIVAWTSVGPHTGFSFAADEVSNLDHLEGLEVDIVGDGAVYPRKFVTAGAVPLDPPAAIVEAGLPYTSKLVTLRPEAPGSTIQGLTVARADIALRVLSTVSVRVNGVVLPDRSSEDPMDGPPLPFTGDIFVPSLGWGPDAGKIEIVQDLPIPATLLAIVGNVAISDE